MEKLLLPILILMIFMVACSSDSQTEETDAPDETAGDAGVEHPQPESLFIHEFSKDDRYDFTGIDASHDGHTVLFTTKEEIKRDEQRYEFIIVGDEEAKNVKELSEASEEDLEGRRCSRTNISPDGRYLTFSCASDERWFVVYDTEEQQIVHHQQALEDANLGLVGITNNMDIILENNDQNKIAIYHLETEEMKEFSIPELSGIEGDHFSNVYVADDGKKVVLNNQERISILDTEAGTLEEVMNVGPFAERFKDETDSMSIGNLRVSSNGNYLFYLLGGSLSRETVYQSINFVNLETGETKSFTDFDYKNFRSIDDRGNMLLGDNDQLYLYNIDNDTTYHIPNVKVGTYTEYITLTADGKHVYYGDRVRDSDEQPAYELFHLPIGELDDYEVGDFMGTVEDIEALLGEAATSGDTNNQNGDIAMRPVNQDVKALFEEKREESATVPYPTAFPEEVSSISESIHHESFWQTIRLDPAELTKRRDLVYKVNTYPDRERKDFCIDDDLELEETIDGVDYYFYLFNNEEVELAFVKDDRCFSLEGKGFTKDEMFDVIESLDTQGKRLSDLPLEEIKFPAQLPLEKTEVKRFHTNQQGSDYTYFVVYGGNENELEITYEVATKEPKDFDHTENVAVELGSSYEAYFKESTLHLYAYDGNYYYTVRAEAKNDVIAAHGGEESINEILVEIMSTLE